jgi:DnaK suppressor protein
MTIRHDEIERFRRELEAKRAELAGPRDAEGIAIERAADSVDEVLLANERELIVERLNREAHLIRQVADALDRITTGEYGICLECEEPISAKRLTALPWAALCLSCQESADREPGEREMPRRSSSITEAA